MTLSRKDKILCLIFFIIIITAIVHYPSLNNSFINWDDDVYVVTNADIRNISWVNIKEVFTSPYVGTYTPFTLLTYAVDYRLAKLNPRVYHATNLILHLFNCILVFWFIYLLCGKEYVALVVSLFFGLHPLHVEAVAWVSQRKDVLYGFFYFLSLISYLKYLKDQRIVFYIFSLLLFISSCLSKPMAITLPLILFLIDYFFHFNLNKQKIFEKIPYLIVSFVFGFFTIVAQYDYEYTTPKHVLFFSHNIFVAGYVLLFYIYKIVFPFHLSGLHPLPQNIGTELPLIYYPSLFVSILLVLLIVLRLRNNRKLVFGSGFFFLTILPVLQFLPISWAIAADRYVYVPAMGIFYLFAEGCYWLYREKIAKRALIKIIFLFIIVSIVTIFSFLSWQRCHIWKDSVTFWSDIIEKYPNTAIAYNNRGSAYLNKGDYLMAILDYKKAFSHDPGMIIALDNIIRAYWMSGMKDKARNFYEVNIQKEAALEREFLDLGKKYINIRKIHDAIIFYQILLEIAPQKGEIYNNLALAYLYKKEYELAEKYLAQLIKAGHNVNPEVQELLKTRRK